MLFHTCTNTHTGAVLLQRQGPDGKAQALSPPPHPHHHHHPRRLRVFDTTTRRAEIWVRLWVGLTKQQFHSSSVERAAHAEKTAR